MNNANFAHDALNYLTLGFSVIPIREKEKRPLIRWEKFQNNRATENTIMLWDSKWPGANIGIVTGRISGVVVVDIDSVAGREHYISQFGEIHNTISQETGAFGKIHLFFKYPGFSCANQAGFLPDVDIRGDGGYVVVAPSVHPSGKKYEWIIDPREHGLDDLMDCPKELLEMLRHKKDQQLDQNREGWVQDALEGVKKGQRNEMCAKLAGYFLRVHKGDVAEVEKKLLEWNDRNIPPLGWKEVGKTIRSIRSRQSIAEVAGTAGIEIEKIKNLVYPDGNHVFLVCVRGHEIEMSMDVLTSPIKCFNKIAEVTHFVGQVKSRTAWLDLINPILADAQTSIMSEDETMAGFVKSIISANLKEAENLSRINDRFIVMDETVHAKMDVVMSEANYDGVRIRHPREMGTILRKIGFDVHNFRDSNGKQFRIWKTSIENLN